MRLAKVLSLHILNSESLASGKQASVVFNGQGGTLGSDEDNAWQLDNQAHLVKSVHAKIELIDANYCISSYAEHLYLNGIDLFIKGNPVRLQDGDLLDLYDLQIRVEIGEKVLKNASNVDFLMPNPEDIIASYTGSQANSLQDDAHILSNIKGLQNNKVEPSLIANNVLNPMELLGETPVHNSFTYGNSSAYNNDDFKVVNVDLSHDNVLEHSMTLGKETNNSEHSFSVDKKDVRTILDDLFQGLGHALALQNAKQVGEFLEEIGSSIKTVIEGLQELHTNNHHLADKHLRPIEDNPLRLNLSYIDTLNLLYAADKYPVHLAATSAIKESLDSIKLHYEANQMAISEALAVLLASFAPDELIKRFLSYRRASEKSQTNGDWSWDMYNNYYHELNSNRQQGFDKLFWEVYEIAYDRHIRSLQKK